MSIVNRLSSILLFFIGLSAVRAEEGNHPFTALGMIPELKNAIGEYATYKQAQREIMTEQDKMTRKLLQISLDLDTPESVE